MPMGISKNYTVVFNEVLLTTAPNLMTLNPAVEISRLYPDPKKIFQSNGSLCVIPDVQPSAFKLLLNCVSQV